MSGLAAKATLTLAAALSTAAVAAPSVQIWVDIPGAGHQQRHHGHPHQHHGRVPHHQPYYQPQYQPKPPTTKQLCDSALFQGAQVHDFLPLTRVGFIERHGYACKVSFNNQNVPRVTGSYDLYKSPASLTNAKNSAFRAEDNKAAQYYNAQPQFRFRIQLP